MRAIRRNGLRLRGSDVALDAPMAAAESLGGTPDLILLAVKTQDLPQAAREIAAFSGSALR